MVELETLTDPGARRLAFVPVVMAANALSAMWLYRPRSVTRRERRGGPCRRGDLLGLAIPPLIGVAGLLLS